MHKTCYSMSIFRAQSLIEIAGFEIAGFSYYFTEDDLLDFLQQLQ